MTQFHEGQEVEVWGDIYPKSGGRLTDWRKAKILNDDCIARKDGVHCYTVQFPNGTRAVFDTEHIRTDTPRGANAIHPMETLR
jgi:hypothetical protein